MQEVQALALYLILSNRNGIDDESQAPRHAINYLRITASANLSDVISQRALYTDNTITVLIEKTQAQPRSRSFKARSNHCIQRTAG